jgi:hypothetical protein
LEAAGYLDGWISKGGFLPAAWNGQPDGEKMYLSCRGCGEVFDSIIPARDHGSFIPGPDPSWCGEDGFDIIPESEAF